MTRVDPDSHGQEVIGVFASEYVPAPFDAVCRALDRPSPPVDHLRVTHGLRRRSGTVAAMDIEWADPSFPADWRPGEIRIIRAQSGPAPLTELLLVVASPGATDGARLLLHGLARRVELTLSGAAGPERRSFAAGSS